MRLRSGTVARAGSSAGSGQDTQGPPGLRSWWKRENLLTGCALLLITAGAWLWTLRHGSGQTMPMPGASRAEGGAGTGAEPHAGMEMVGDAVAVTGGAARSILPLALDLSIFLGGWSIMMIAMMLPAVIPLVLLYRATARRRLRPAPAVIGLSALLSGYFFTWTLAGVPVFFYGRAMMGAAAMGLLPAILLISGGVYQFTALKHGCHVRCSSPLFLLARHWRPGLYPAARLGLVHGIDCLGCCLGLMLALVGLGMMNVAWMLTAAIIIFAEKTLPGGHRIARPLGLALVVGGSYLLLAALAGTGVPF